MHHILEALVSAQNHENIFWCHENKQVDLGGYSVHTGPGIGEALGGYVWRCLGERGARVSGRNSVMLSGWLLCPWLCAWGKQSGCGEGGALASPSPPWESEPPAWRRYDMDTLSCARGGYHFDVVTSSSATWSGCARHAGTRNALTPLRPLINDLSACQLCRAHHTLLFTSTGLGTVI